MHGYDVIVVGLGAMGAAALRELARRGARTLGIERFEIAHGHGSSAGDTRLIRLAYFEHADYVPLLRRAYRLWRELEAQTGRSLLFETGTLYLGTPDGELITGSQRSAREHGLALERLDEAALRARAPAFRLPEGYVAAFEPEAGFVLCERALGCFAEQAAAHGAVIREGEQVLGWEPVAGGVAVTTNRDRYQADAVVLAAGSWSASLLGTPGVPLTVTRQPLFWIEPAAPPGTFDLGRSPCWAIQRPDRPGLFYGFPRLPGELAPTPGVKLAHHAPGETTAADAPRRPAGDDELGALLDAVAPFLPRLAGPKRSDRVCLYTLSADGHFVLDRHPQHPQVVFGCGFSGHGFKFAPVIGEALADLALGGRSALPIEFLGLR
jgi:sarcosine oxidase